MALAVWQRASVNEAMDGLSWAEMRTNMTSRHGMCSVGTGSRARQLGRRRRVQGPRARCMSSLPSHSSDSACGSQCVTRGRSDADVSSSVGGVNGGVGRSDVEPWTLVARSRRGSLWLLVVAGVRRPPAGSLAPASCRSGITSSASRVWQVHRDGGVPDFTCRVSS